MTQSGSRSLKLAALALLCLIQLAVPASMIAQYERTLSTGQVMRVRCEPVDPLDLFRGRYVRIRLEELRIANGERMGEYLGDENAYMSVEKDDAGFMRVVSVDRDPPEAGLYFQAMASMNYEDDRAYLVAQLPFDRFYMREDLAPLAERSFRDAEIEAFVTIRILDGFAALEELYLDGKPVAEFLKDQGGS